MNGGLGGENVESLLGMDMVEAESAFGDVASIRRLKGGDDGVDERMGEVEEERQRKVVMLIRS